MPSPFDAIEATIFREVAAVFGEQFVLRPMRARPNKGPVPDDDRQVICFTGQMRQPHKSEHMGRLRPAGRADISVTQPQVEALLCDFPEPPRQGDLVERVDPATVYEVSDIRPNGHGRCAIKLLMPGVRNQSP
jgi:hypothetical protein